MLGLASQTDETFLQFKFDLKMDDGIEHENKEKADPNQKAKQ